MNQQFYDDFSARYDLWTSCDPYTLELIDFYTHYFSSLAQEETLVELGIGTGNIGLEVLKHSAHKLIGVDNSERMLSVCAGKTKSKRLTLVEADISVYMLKSKVNYIYLPYRTLCHFVSLEEKKKLLENIYNNLEVGGTFIFDCDNPNEERMRLIHNKPQLVYAKDEFSIYQLSKFDFKKQSMHVSIVDANSKKESAEVHKYNFSWIEPAQIKVLLDEVGFKIVNVYGNTKKNPLEKESHRQIYEVMKV